MRVLLCVKMEGVSQITSYRELWSAFPEFCETGRPAATADTLAAINGLRAGGATSITVCQLDGAMPEPVIDLEALPDSAGWAPKEEVFRYAVLQQEFDALFMLGWQARCGTPDAFMSHTEGINLRVAIDGKPVTDVHINAWRTRLPLLGVVGDAALETQLDGALEGVPFLAVKKSSSRTEATPLYSEEKSSAAIEAFASWCVHNAAKRSPLPIPERFVLSMSMPPRIADLVDGEHELRRTSPAIVAKSVTDWWYEAEPAIAAAMQASFSPLRNASDEAERRRVLEEWATMREPEWLT
ncbi:MAG: M55 family metallopeptidase [Thermomicrobiales bacterium]